MPRVPVLHDGELSEPLAQLFRDTAARRTGVSNLHRALAGSPGVFVARMAYSNALRDDIKLDKLARELTILLVARLTDSGYEFAHHWGSAIKAGAYADQLAAILDYRDSPLFDARLRAILDLARESTVYIAVDDKTWNAAAAFLDTQQMIDLVLTIAWYNQTSRVIAALGIELEDGYTAEGGYRKT